MSIPDWFRQRRYGLFVHQCLASVPAFSPLHEYAEWYWSHLAPEPLADVLLHPAPLPEVQAWHAQHHPGKAYDDFIDGLTLDAYDAPAIAALAVEAGMGYVVQTSKHHDGWCFFDSALTDRTTVRQGPRRDAIGELAEASRAAGLVYGLYHSLLDWSHPDYGTDAYVSGYLHPQVVELVERYAPSVLWGDGHWGKPASYWRSEELLERYRAALGAEAAVNDRWAAEADFLTYEYDTPARPPAGPFEVTRAVGYSFGLNRVEREEDHLTATAIVALLTEVVAKGGNLLLDIGPAADGSVPEAQARPLREAGRWVRGVAAGAIDGSVPLRLGGEVVWGDGSTRYTVTPSDDGLLHVNAIDLTGAARARFAALGPDRVALVDGDATADRGGVVAVRPAGQAGELAAVHRLVLRPVDEAPVVLRGPAPSTAARIDDRPFGSVGEALAAATAGDLVEVAAGVHDPASERFPLVVPAGVRLRGPASAVLDAAQDRAVGSATPEQGGGDLPAVVVLAGAGAGVEGVTVTGAPQAVFFLPPVAVLAEGADDVTVERCTLRRGSVVIRGGRGARVVGNEVDGASITVAGATGATVRGNRQTSNRWGVGVLVEGGSDVVVSANDLAEDLAGIRCSGTDGAVVSGNRIRARWWGIHLDGSTAASVAGNEVRGTMRAICLTGGGNHRVAGNRASGCDSGVLLEGGVDGVALVDNLLEDCRLGVFDWSSSGLEVRGGVVLRPREVAG